MADKDPFWNEFLMYKRFLITFLCLLVTLLQACGGDKAQNGSLTVRADLTILDIDLEGLVTDFSPDVFGPYDITVDNAVDSIDVTVGELNEEEGVEIYVFRSANLTSGNLDGRDNEQVVAEGATVNMPLDEGDNVINVRIRTTDLEQFRDYSFSVRRISQSADLSFLGFPTSSNVDFESPDSFDPDETEYTFSVPYTQCTISLFAFAESRYAELYFDGEEIARGASRFIDLPVGTSDYEIEVRAEDGDATKTYSLSIEREAATDDELEEDYTFSSLGLAEADIGSVDRGEGFYCGFRAYSARVDNEISSVTLAATPSISTRTIQVGEQIETITQDDDGVDVSEFSVEEWFDLPADGSVVFDVEVGDDNVFVFSTREDDDGEPITEYAITVTRSETNRTIVETGEELQAALMAAAPNDEIYIVSDEALTAAATLDASGKEGVAFYSAASGTAEQPIVLVNATGEAISPAEGFDGATTLEIAGDYWEITAIEISGGSAGLILNNANHNLMKNIEVSNTSDIAVQLLNGSNDNAFADLTINHADGRGLVVGSDASTWTTAPAPGAYESLNLNNHFGTIELGPYIVGTHIHIEEGASNTIIRSAVFELTGLSTEVDASVIDIQGNDTEISFSEFNDPEGFSPVSLINISDAGYEWLTDQWGENTFLTDSWFDLGGLSGINILSADATVDLASVSNNVRQDGVAVSYSGVAVDENYARPLYQFQWIDYESVADDLSDVADHTYCLSRQDLSLTLISSTSSSVISSVDGVVAAACDNSDVNQHWDFATDGDGYVLVTDPEGLFYAAPAFQGVMVSSGADGIVMFDAETYADSSAYFLRWTIEAGPNGEFLFSNKISRSHVLTIDTVGFIQFSTSVVGAFSFGDDEDAYILYAQRENGELQSSFSLVPVQ